MKMNMMDAADKYQRDPHFKAVVDMLVHQALSLDMSPGELREAAIFAEIKFQCMQPAHTLFPNRAKEIGLEMQREDEAR